MRGHLRKRGEAWELRAYAGRDPVSGRPIYRTRTFRGGKRDAEDALPSSSRRCRRRLHVTRRNGRHSPRAMVRARQGRSLPLDGPRLRDVHQVLPRADARRRPARPPSRRPDRPASTHSFEPVAGQVGATTRDRNDPPGPRRAASCPPAGRQVGLDRLESGSPRVPAARPEPTIESPEPTVVTRLIQKAGDDNPDLAVFLQLAATTGLVAASCVDCTGTRSTSSAARSRSLAPRQRLAREHSSRRTRRLTRSDSIALDPTSVQVPSSDHHDRRRRASQCLRDEPPRGLLRLLAGSGWLHGRGHRTT